MMECIFRLGEEEKEIRVSKQADLNNNNSLEITTIIIIIMIKVHKPQSRQSYLLCYCRPFGRLSLSTHFGDVLNQVRCVSENRIKLPTVTSSSEESLFVMKDFSLVRVIATPY